MCTAGRNFVKDNRIHPPTLPSLLNLVGSGMPLFKRWSPWLKKKTWLTSICRGIKWIGSPRVSTGQEMGEVLVDPSAFPSPVVTSFTCTYDYVPEIDRWRNTKTSRAKSACVRGWCQELSLRLTQGILPGVSTYSNPCRNHQVSSD